jgi:hypothetical protein
MFLLGHSEMRADAKRTGYQSVWNQANDNFWVTNYHNPSNQGPLRFGQKQANGEPEMPYLKYDLKENTAWNQGTYAVYQGKLLDDRLTLVAGARRDRNEAKTAQQYYVDSPMPTSARRPTSKQTTTQFGATFAITRAVSVYGLESEGLQPNLDGKRDVNGVPVPAMMAKSREFGLKVDLLDGKISGTISAFKIRRHDAPILYWWAPTSNKPGRFDPTKDIVYQVKDLKPPGKSENNGAAQANAALWDACVASGSIYAIGENWYANVSKHDAAAWLDANFDYTKAHGGMLGWIYNEDAYTNNVSGTRVASAGGDEFVLGDDSSKGWDGQLLFTPTDNFQVMLSYAHLRREVEQPGKFAKSPYPQDRWASWYFPNANWGLTRVPLSTAYTDPADTSTWQGINWGKGQPMDDTPKHHVSVWASHDFKRGIAKGLTIGAGGYFESPRQYVSGITHGGGQQIVDKNGNGVVLETDSRYNSDLMVRYAFKLSKRDASVQLNVNNVLNDQKLYGLIYSAPTTARMEFACKF